MQRFLYILPILLAYMTSPVCSHADDSRPNFVIILADDLGYGDLGCYGHEIIKTPYIDRLAKQGILYTDCHSAATVCSPSRAGMLTGRNPRRVGIYGWIPEDSPMHLRDEETTIAEKLQAEGYATCLVGKYHCNGKFNSPEQPQPGDQGFDYWFATQNNAHPTHENPDNFVRNGNPLGRMEGYSSTLIVDEALNWLETIENDKPYALFVWFHAPHEPIETFQEFMDLYADIAQPERATYYGNVSEMDHNVGRLMQTLEDRNEADNTFVFFTSDNGPTEWYRKSYGEAGSLRGMKGEIWEGGHRVPGIVRWPSKVEPETISDELINGVDLFPTICDILGMEIPSARPIDGASFLPTFSRGKVSRKVPLYWQKHWKAGPHVAIRDDHWKLVATYGKKWSLKNFALYDLKADLAEEKDVSEDFPERFEQMKESLRTLNKEIHAEGPQWDTAKAKKGFKSITASSSRNENRRALFAIDGSRKTRWSSEFGDQPQWLQVELQRPKELKQIQIIWESAAAEQYTVSISADGKNFEEIATINDGKSAEKRKIACHGAEVQTIRFDFQKRTSKWGYSVKEINAW